ncbi:unnamed protein product [Closterium sp. NIES-53]
MAGNTSAGAGESSAQYRSGSQDSGVSAPRGARTNQGSLIKEVLKNFTVEQFNGEGYDDWAWKMQLYFRQIGLLKLMIGEEPRPSDPALQEDWDERASAGYYLMLQSLEPNQRHHVMHLLLEVDCGPKPWTVLKELHAPTSVVATLILEREVSTLRLSEGEPVQPVLDKIRDLYAKLATAGITYPEQTKCMKMRSLLPESWLQFTSGLSLPQTQSLWTLEWVRTKILEEDFRHRQLRGGDDGSSGYGMQGSRHGRGRGFGGAGRGAKKDDDSNDQQGGTGWGRGAKSGRGGKSVEGDLRDEEYGPAAKSRFIVDDWSRLMWAYPLKQKDHAASTIKEDWLPFVEKQADCVVKRIRTDRGGEFLGAETTAWHKKQGIQRELTTTYSPQFNGVAERTNRTILETARALLIESGVDNSMWPHAVRHATVARNRVLTKVGNESWVPLERWLGWKPPVDMLRVFGCMVVAHVPKKYRTKLGASAIWCVHLGLAAESKGWLLREPSKGVLFDGRDLDLTPSVWEEGEEAAAEDGDGEKVQEAPAGGGDDVETSDSTKEAAGSEGGEQQLGKSKVPALPTRRKPKAFHYEGMGDTYLQARTSMATLKLTAGADVAEQQLGNEEALLILLHGYDPDGEDEPAYCFLAPAPEEPASREEALAGPDREKWLVSRDAEYQSLLENGTWDLVSRLVAKGFMQKEKHDFNGIFAPTAKPPTLRVLLADATVSGKFIIQMDISTAFLNGILEEDVYMTQPPRYEDGTGRVCKLKKSIYGLKQAPRCWYQKLAAVLEEMGFRTSSCDESLFLKGEGEKLETKVSQQMEQITMQLDLTPSVWEEGEEAAAEGGDGEKVQEAPAGGGDDVETSGSTKKAAGSEGGEQQQGKTKVPALPSRRKPKGVVMRGWETPVSRPGHTRMATMKLTAGADVAEQQLGNEEALLILPHGYDPDEKDEPAYCFLAPAPEEPASMEEALAGPDREKWLVSRDAEYQSLLENGTWDLVVLPEGKKAVPCKCVLRIKTDDKGQVTIYKSRLVAKGFMQKEEQDFNEIFSPTAKPLTLRVLLVDAAVSGKFIIQMDISTAFLNGILEEDVYMTQPPGYEDGTGWVCKLKRSIYGLKQAPRCWYQKLAAVLEEMGFRTSSCDESLFLKGEGGKLVLFLVYMDNIFLFSSSMKEIQNVQWLKLHQEKFIKELGEKYGIENERKVATPLPAEFKLVKAAEDEGVKAEEQQQFQSLVGSLLYAAVHTRPDISCSVGQLARVVQNPSEEQVDAAERVVKYLNSHPSIGVQYSASAQEKQKGVEVLKEKGERLGEGKIFLTCFTDATWASEKDDSSSVGGYICVVGGGPVSWRSKKQTETALSSVESEYMAMFHGVKEVIWLRRLLEEIGQEQKVATSLFCDSNGAILMARNAVLHGMNKHMRIKWHWLRKEMKRGTVNPIYIKTHQQPADFLTKRLAVEPHWRCVRMSGMSMN